MSDSPSALRATRRLVSFVRSRVTVEARRALGRLTDLAVALAGVLVAAPWRAAQALLSVAEHTAAFATVFAGSAGSKGDTAALALSLGVLQARVDGHDARLEALEGAAGETTVRALGAKVSVLSERVDALVNAPHVIHTDKAVHVLTSHCAP